MSLGMFDTCGDIDAMKHHFEVGETAVTVICDDSYLRTAEQAVFDARQMIERKISDDPFFGTTYDPYPVSAGDDELIKRMCQASVSAGVGPMAGVAGAVAVYTVERVSEAGASHVIVENGGDIALKIDRDVTVGVFQDDERFRDIAFRVPKRDGIFGICSSSGNIGPSVSFGKSSISTVFSDDVILADACATALGNLVGNGSEDELSKALEEIGSTDGVDGCVCISNGLFATFGNVPELIRAEKGNTEASRIFF